MRLIDADALEKRFEAKIDEWRGSGPLPTMECLMWIAAKDIIDDTPTVNAIPMEWICAKDRLPEKRGRYLVMLKTDGKIGFEVHDHLHRIMYFGNQGWRLPRHYPEWIHEALKQEVTH